MKWIRSVSAVLILTLFLSVPARATERNSFTDLDPSAWYYDHVAWVVEQGLFLGTSQTTFSPNAPMTRAMFVTALGRRAGAQVTDTGSTFDDVPAGAYYAPYVQWAAENGIVNGTDKAIFSPDKVITREQVAAILYRYLAGGEESNQTTLDAYVDRDSISGYARQGLAWAVEAGILQGYNQQLHPQESATRAQIAAIREPPPRTDPLKSSDLAKLKKLVEEQLPGSCRWDERVLQAGWYGPMTLRMDGTLENIAEGCVYLLTELDGITYDMWYLTEPEQGSFVCWYG